MNEAESPDFDKLRSEILAIHRAQIAAHLEKDVDSLVQNIGEGFLAVSNGDIVERTAQDFREIFEDYLPNTQFAEYRDLQEPLVGFSKDGSLAWSIVQVKIAGERKMADGSLRELDFTCAWMTLFERRGEDWIKISEVSTFR